MAEFYFLFLTWLVEQQLCFIRHASACSIKLGCHRCNLCLLVGFSTVLKCSKGSVIKASRRSILTITMAVTKGFKCELSRGTLWTVACCELHLSVGSWVKYLATETCIPSYLMSCAFLFDNLRPLTLYVHAYSIPCGIAKG